MGNIFETILKIIEEIVEGASYLYLVIMILSLLLVIPLWLVMAGIIILKIVDLIRFIFKGIWKLIKRIFTSKAVKQKEGNKN